MKKIYKYISIYILMILIFISLMILVSLIPSKWIEKNVKSSADFLLEEGEHKYITTLIRTVMLDNYTDALMIDNAYSIDSKNPVESAILVRENYIPEISTDITTDVVGEHIKPKMQTEELYNLVNQNPEQAHEYARYWHGYLVYLRPLLLLLNYQKIRILIAIVLYGLMAKLIYELCKKTNKITAIIFAVAYICVDIQLLFLSLQSMITFLLSTIFSIFILKRNDKIKNINLLFFILGGITCFFDFLTTPLITLGIPLIIYLLCNEQNELKNIIKIIIKICFTWLVGYLSIWISKWVITDILFKREIIKTSIEQFFYRSSKTKLNIFEIYIKNIGRLNIIFLELVSIIFIFTLIKNKCKFNKKNIKKAIPYFIIMLMPFVQYTIMRQHSGMHAFFTYRSLVVFILGFGIGIIKLLDEYKEKVILKEIILKKYNIIFPIIINILFIGVMLLTNNFYYETVDDYMMQEISAGYYGEYSEYILQTNIIVGKILKLLFTQFPTINWYFILLALLQFIAFTTIGYYLIKQNGKKLGSVLYATIIIPFYLVFIINFQYTSIAYTLMAAGLIAQIYSINKKKTGQLIYGLILIVIATLLRFQCYYTYLIYLLVYVFIKVMKKEKVLKLIMANLIILVLVILLKNFSMNYYINSNPIYKQYFEYNKVRVLHNDILNITYKNNEDIYNKVNWSENDKFLLEEVAVGDEDVFSYENLETIYNSYINEKNIIDYIKDNSHEYIEKIGELLLTMYAIPLYMCIICIAVSNKEKRKDKIIIFVACLIQHIVYILIGKAVVRVIFPTYLIAYLLIIFNIGINFGELKEKILKSNIIIKIIVIFLIVSSIFSWIPRYIYKKEEAKYTNTYNELISYIYQNKQNAYVYSPYALTNRHMRDSILHLYRKGVYENLFAMGSWQIYSKEYYEFKSRYDIDNMYKDLIEKENVYLIDSNMWYENGFLEYIITFLNERYYNQEIKYELVKSIDDRINIYKLYI